MSLFSVQLKVAANQEVLDLIGEAMSPTLYDALEPVPDLSSLPVNELRVDSLEKVIDLLQLEGDITARRFVLDLRNVYHQFTRLVVYLGPVLYRWKGEEFVVMLPSEGD